MEEKILYTNLLIEGTLKLHESINGEIILKTIYQYDGKVKYSFNHINKIMNMTWAIRIPEWSKTYKISKNNIELKCEVKDGYAYINDSFTENDKVTLELNMRPYKIYANSKVSCDNGKVAIGRAPLIYCAEDRTRVV